MLDKVEIGREVGRIGALFHVEIGRLKHDKFLIEQWAKRKKVKKVEPDPMLCSKIEEYRELERELFKISNKLLEE